MEEKKKGMTFTPNCQTQLLHRPFDKSIEMCHAAACDGHARVEFLAYRKEGQKIG